MGMIERVIRALIYLCVIAICYYLILWVLAALGIHIPAQILTIMMVIFALIAILVLIRLFYPFFSSQNWWGNP